MEVALTGSGYYIPSDQITNDELTNSFNKYVETHNRKNPHKTKTDTLKSLKLSDPLMIKRISGIEKRYTIDKKGILDNKYMHPRIPTRPDAEFSLQCELSIKAAKKALTEAHLKTNEIDGIILACTYLQRPYPSVSIEVQKALGCKGWAIDLPAACSSATFAIHTAYSMLMTNAAKKILIVTPEIYTPHLNFKDRNTHFIFSDASSAVILEPLDHCKSTDAFQIVGTKIETSFSNEIRSNFGFLNRCEYENETQEIKVQQSSDYLFTQNGANVKREIPPLVINHLKNHINSLNIPIKKIKRLWLHQANVHMNEKIAKDFLSEEYSEDKAPSTLSKFGNTGAAGCIITFSEYKKNFIPGEIGIIAGFGAGFSIGSIVIKKISTE